MFSVSNFRLLLCLGMFLCLFTPDRGAMSMFCDLRPCADELSMQCPYGLQRDQIGCKICACRPAPGRLCTRMLCNLLCLYTPHRLHLCPTCPCAQAQQTEPQPPTYKLYGASPENVDAAMTGQIDVTAARVIDRHDGLCYTTASSLWRTADGTCNNVKNYGATFMPVMRLLPPVYGDGRESPRTRSARGQKLPSARLISRVVHTDVNHTGMFTVMFMQFGQFIDHDITSFPLLTEQNHAIRCCDDQGHRIVPPPHKDCFPIDLADDSFFYPRTCMEFVRSVPARNTDGQSILPRENVNAVTAFVDGSAIYGSSEEHMRQLRDDGGTGIYLRTSAGSFLPFDTTDSCVRRRTSNMCFLAGDERVNEQPGLTALHTIFLRLHNRIASSLRRLLPQIGNEEIFQRSRAYVGAILQNILYGQWLPLVLGPANMYRYGLETGRSVMYNSDIDPRISSVFSTSAFRFGHSLIPATLTLGTRTSPFRDLFNKPMMCQYIGKQFAQHHIGRALHKRVVPDGCLKAYAKKIPVIRRGLEVRVVLNNLNQLTQGLISAFGSGHQRALRVDRHFVGDVTNHLFGPRDQPRRALDLVSLNIQRGRDHGLPPFEMFRRACGLRSLNSFRDGALGTAGELLERVYSDASDIDMFTGSMVEPPSDDAIVGPTTVCILARQFHALKYGDRFYFEAFQTPNPFSARQVAELRKATLAWVLCDTLPFSRVQRDVFQVEGTHNPVLTCDEVKAAGPNLRILAEGR